MTPDEWTRLNAVLDAAFDLEANEQAAYLDTLDLPPALLERAKALLEADARDAVLDAPERLGVLFDAVEDEADTISPGTEIGPYRVVRTLGTGGMGMVALADRADGAFEKQVALKLVRPGLASGMLARFRSERRILAQLEHPGIARLLDGGRTDDGRPYLAMEYVEGEPITDYADRHRLNVDARLELFEQVCDAVSYAHRQLVVHRDIKPSNILVSDTGRVKLLDFGIAKLLDDNATLVETATGQRLMTPAYAAPEQVRGEPPSTATDVYALGVLLYELLTGRRPYALEDAARHAIERAILEDEPTRPSTAVLEGDTQPLATARQTETSRLRRRLEGDLDQIVLMALRKEPERRYDGAGSLGRDVRRHLDRVPVEARPDSAAYRLSRFATRNRVGVAASALALCAVTALTTVYVWRLQVERDRAETAAQTSEAVTDFVVGLFVSPDPSSGAGRDLTVLSALEGADARLDRHLEDEPVVQARLLDVLGRLYVNLGGYEEASRFQNRATELLRALHGQQHPDLAEALLWTGKRLHLEGRYLKADSAYQAAQSALQRPDSRGIEPRLLADRGINALRAGEASQADSLLRLAIQQEERRTPTDSIHLAYALNELAVVAHDAGDLDEAEALNRRALGIRQRLLAPMSADVGRSYNDLGLVLRDAGRFEEAQPLHQRAVAIALSVYGRESENTAAAFNGLAQAYRGAMRYARADSAFAASEAIVAETVGREHPVYGFLNTNRGANLQLWGRPAEAERSLQGAATLLASTIGPDNPRTALAQIGLGDALSDLGRHREALARYTEAQQTLTAAFGPNHREARDAALRRVHALAAIGRGQEAIGVGREVLAQTERSPDRGSPRHAEVLRAIAVARLSSGETSLAAQSASQALGLLDQADESRSERRAETLLTLARIEAVRGQSEAARRHAQAAASLWRDRVLNSAPRLRAAEEFAR